MVILDTCALIWLSFDQSKLSQKAKKYIELAEKKDALGLSEISFWEIALLIERKKFNPGTDYLTYIELLMSAYRFTRYHIDPLIAYYSVILPNEIPRDPADRIICATAITNGLKLITADKILRKSKVVETVW